MVLFINACARKGSRTLELAEYVLSTLKDDIVRVDIYDNSPTGLTPATLSLRDDLLAAGGLDHPMFNRAHQFASADTVVIAAPYWDMLFPAVVRAYLEEVTVVGVTLRYNENGQPEGLCKAKKIIYVTTAGGKIVHNFGFEYVRTLASEFYGITEAEFVVADGLDLFGADVAAILDRTKKAYHTEKS